MSLISLALACVIASKDYAIAQIRQLSPRSRPESVLVRRSSYRKPLNLLKNIDFTETPVIWLSCNQGGLNANSSLTIERLFVFDPSEALLAERTVWHDIRFLSHLKQRDRKKGRKYSSKQIYKFGGKSDRSLITQATHWIRTKDNKIRLMNGFVGLLTPTQSPATSCRQKK